MQPRVPRDPRRRDARGERRVSGGERPREAEESIGIGPLKAREPLPRRIPWANASGSGRDDEQSGGAATKTLLGFVI